jgi:hypothetical protein
MEIGRSVERSRAQRFVGTQSPTWTGYIAAHYTTRNSHDESRGISNAWTVLSGVRRSDERAEWGTRSCDRAR